MNIHRRSVLLPNLPYQLIMVFVLEFCADCSEVALDYHHLPIL